MPTYSNDPSGEPPPRNVPPPAPAYVPADRPPQGYAPPPPYAAGPPGYPPGPPAGPDNRPLLVAVVVALVALVAVLGYYLLVYVPARDARLAAASDVGVAVQADRPPGALSEGDGFRPSAIEPAPAAGPDAQRSPDAAAGPSGDEVPELERPPRRAPAAAPTAGTPTAPEAPAARAEHATFAEAYLGRQSGSSVDEAVAMYAPAVRYYGLGRVDAQTVSDDKAAYFGRFPDRRYTLASPVRVVSSTGSGAATLRFDYTYALGGGPGGERAGRAYVELDVVPAGGSYLIEGERGDVY